MPDPFITESWKKPSNKETINSAARRAGRQHIKNRIIRTSYSGSVIAGILKLKGGDHG